MAIDLQDMNKDPFVQFDEWFSKAVTSQQPQANAMCLSTVSSKGQPSSRMVLLKDHGSRGFTFFTNYGSRKASEIWHKPLAAINFYWPGLGKQIRIEGSLTQVLREESEAYFRTRPRESQIGAWASQQSQILQSRQELEDRFGEFERKFANQEVPCPSNWGGFLLTPVEFEFWSERPGRLHDRFQYLQASSGWTLQRLSP